jgi:hypothetical protein
MKRLWGFYDLQMPPLVQPKIPRFSRKKKDKSIPLSKVTGHWTFGNKTGLVEGVITLPSNFGPEPKKKGKKK